MTTIIIQFILYSQEAEHRRVQRLEAIERANNLMYDQTDKMKYLKGAKMYADVVKTREAQVEFKRGKKEVEKKEAASYHEEIMKKVRAGEIEEEEKKQKIIDKIEIIKVQRREQVMEVRARRAAEAAEAKAIGEAMKKQAQERIEEDMAEQVRKAEMIASSNAGRKSGEGTVDGCGQARFQTDTYSSIISKHPEKRKYDTNDTRHVYTITNSKNETYFRVSGIRSSKLDYGTFCDERLARMIAEYARTHEKSRDEIWKDFDLTPRQGATPPITPTFLTVF